VVVLERYSWPERADIHEGICSEASCLPISDVESELRRRWIGDMYLRAINMRF